MNESMKKTIKAILMVIGFAALFTVVFAIIEKKLVPVVEKTSSGIKEKMKAIMKFFESQEDLIDIDESDSDVEVEVDDDPEKPDEDLPSIG